MLRERPLSRSEISRLIGQRRISGQLNVVIKSLLYRGIITFTIPGKRGSRLQKYRLTTDQELLVHVAAKMPWQELLEVERLSVDSGIPVVELKRLLTNPVLGAERLRLNIWQESANTFFRGVNRGAK